MALCEPVRMIGEIAAFYAYSVDFLHVLGDCHKTGDRPERLAHIIGVKAREDNSFTPVCKLLGYFYKTFIEKLRFVHAYDLNVIRNVKHCLGFFDRGARDAVEVVRDHVHIRIPDIYGRFENPDFLVGELGSFDSSDKFFRLS